MPSVVQMLTRHNRALAVEVHSAAKKGSDRVVVYSPGLQSVRQGQKSDALLDLSMQLGSHFVRYDLFGHGDSSGELAQVTLSGAKSDLSHILDELPAMLPGVRAAYLVGASFGGLVSLHSAIESRGFVRGVATIGGAFDLHSRVRDLTREHNGTFRIASNYCDDIILGPEFPSSITMLGDDDSLAASVRACQLPVTVFHGEEDDAVPFVAAQRFATSAGSLCSLFPIPGHAGGDHRLNLALPLITPVLRSLPFWHEQLPCRAAPRP
mmetsp:Transcript_18544/g.34356  ORF Transcript_18544/g.34356 Transcript_18544/m.34356 type:complete len:266 (+) Transcript_18544:206-1003(+)